MNLYVRSADAWDDGPRRRTARFLTEAAVPVVNRWLYARAVDRAEHLETAMSSRAGIEQAKGVLMERLELSSDQAFEVLAQASVLRNTSCATSPTRSSRPGSSRSAERRLGRPRPLGQDLRS